jgi:hypothetical protein
VHDGSCRTGRLAQSRHRQPQCTDLCSANAQMSAAAVALTSSGHRSCAIAPTCHTAWGQHKHEHSCTNEHKMTTRMWPDNASAVACSRSNQELLHGTARHCTSQQEAPTQCRCCGEMHRGHSTHTCWQKRHFSSPYFLRHRDEACGAISSTNL